LEPFLPSFLLGAAVSAGLAFVVLRVRRRREDEALREREERAAAERRAHVAEEEALRRRLHEANEALRQRAATLQEILRVSTELKAHLPLEAVLANVVRAAAATLGFRRALVSLHDRVDGALVPRAHVGLADAWPAIEGLRLPSERVVRPGSADGADLPSPLAPHLPETLRGGLVPIPLVAAGHLVGLLELAEPDGRASAPAGDRVALDLFATQAVNAIRLARAHETTRIGSRRDPLTGVANHGHFQETLYREVTRHQRTGERLVLLLVDLDDFKKVNDRHGHPTGDAVLKAVVARLLASVREMDTVARYGGEEFAVVLPQTDADHGHRVAERLRSAVAAAPLSAGLAGELGLTISIGIAVYPDDASSKGALVEAADKALYAAKKTGKNRVVRFTKVPSSTLALLDGRA